MMTQDYIAPELSVKNFPRRGLRVSGVLSLRGRGPIRETPINLPIVLLGNLFEAALRQLCMRISTPQIDTFLVSVRLNRVSLAGDYCLAQARRVLAAEVAEYDVLSESAAIPREIDERRMFAASIRETGPGCDAESAQAAASRHAGTSRSTLPIRPRLGRPPFRRKSSGRATEFHARSRKGVTEGRIRSIAVAQSLR